jgi:hypothetical protein
MEGLIMTEKIGTFKGTPVFAEPMKTRSGCKFIADIPEGYDRLTPYNGSIIATHSNKPPVKLNDKLEWEPLNAKP